MRAFRGLAAAGLAAFLLAAAPGEARAQLDVCNDADEAIDVAIGYADDYYGWISEGWWWVEPGACATVLQEPLAKRFYYLYAESESYYWGGDYFFCIHSPNAFTIYGDQDCDTGFYELDVGSETSWQETLY